MPAVTKGDLVESLHETLGQLRRTEQVNEDLRRRNGELYTALSTLDENMAKRLTPIKNYPTRYVVLDRLVSCAAEIASKTSKGEPVEDDLSDLVEAVSHHRDYWDRVNTKRDERRARTMKARNNKENDDD